MKDFTCRSNESRLSTLKYVHRILLCCAIMSAGVVLLIAQSGKITAKDQKAAEAITAAITALGGEKNIDNIKSLILTGTTKYYAGSAVDETEIRILLPDSYLRIEKRIGNVLTIYRRVSKGESHTVGFTGTGGRVEVYPLTNEVNSFFSLLMGALLKGGPIAPLNLSAVAGTSDKFSIATETGAPGVIEFDPVRKYPLLISYKDVVRNLKMTQTASHNFPLMRLGEEEVIDSVMRFNDRVAVEGIMFPLTIVFESGRKTDGELKIEKVQINPKLTLADFEIPESLR